MTQRGKKRFFFRRKVDNVGGQDEHEKNEKLHKVKGEKKIVFSFLWGQNKRQVRIRQLYN